MALIIETGEGLVDSNSYSSVAELQAYADARGITLQGDPEQLLIQAMDYLESLSYQGYKAHRLQALQWPRYGVSIDGYCVDSDEIPSLLKSGQMAVAVAIDQGNSPLSTIDRTVKREKIGPLEFEYSDSSSSVPIVRTYTAFLYKLLASGMAGFVVSKA